MVTVRHELGKSVSVAVVLLYNFPRETDKNHHPSSEFNPGPPDRIAT